MAQAPDLSDNAMRNREKMAEVLFEQFQLERFYLDQSGVVPLFAAGQQSGLVVGCGHEVSYAAVALPSDEKVHTIKTSNIAGAAVTDCLTDMLQKDGIQDLGSKNQTFLEVQSIKEKTCIVALDYEAFTKQADND